MQYLDMLTRLGVGSAHPGGFKATLSQLNRFPIPAGSRVLEVGCGTGRTACYLAELGMQMTGLDIRPEMLVKARRRAAAANLEVTFAEGSIEALPFSDGQFDIVLAESVTNFADIPASLAEYARVLKPGGILYDREAILAGEPMPQDAYERLTSFFGFRRILGEAEWLQALAGAGFGSVQVWDRSEFSRPAGEELSSHPDHGQMMDSGSILDPQLWQISLEHDELIESNRAYLGYALFVGSKQPTLP